MSVSQAVSSHRVSVSGGGETTVVFKTLELLSNLQRAAHSEGAGIDGIANSLVIAQIPWIENGITVRLCPGSSRCEPTVCVEAAGGGRGRGHLGGGSGDSCQSQLCFRIKLFLIDAETPSKCLEKLERSFCWRQTANPGDRKRSKNSRRRPPAPPPSPFFQEVLWTKWNAQLLLAAASPRRENKVLVLLVLSVKTGSGCDAAVASGSGHSKSCAATGHRLNDAKNDDYSFLQKTPFNSEGGDSGSCTNSDSSFEGSLDSGEDFRFPVVESNSILSDLAREFEDQKLADRWLLVMSDDEEEEAKELSLPFNQTIVELRTPVLAAAFHRQMRERTTGELDFRRVWSAKASKEMLRYVYTDDVENLRENACELLQMSHLYQLHGLFELCEKALLSKINDDDDVTGTEELLAIYLLASRYCRGSYVGLFEAALAEVSLSLYEAKGCHDQWTRLTSDRDAFQTLKSTTKQDPEWYM